MDTLELADTIADPIGTVGMSFYFSPQAMARGEGLELDVVTFYAGGRGGVLGDIDAVHGYGDEDRAEETEDLVATRLAVEVETSTRMAALLDLLDGAQRAALTQGAIALHEAVASPVAAA